MVLSQVSQDDCNSLLLIIKYWLEDYFYVIILIGLMMILKKFINENFYLGK